MTRQLTRLAGGLLLLLAVLAWLACTKGPPSKSASWTLLHHEDFAKLDTTFWARASHTFGGNAARFRPANVYVAGGLLHLLLKKEPSLDRQYTGGELRTRRTFRTGRFVVRMKAAKGSGVVSSFFLFRYNPWQEIDIEFLGKNTRQIHLNTYFNPGPEGAPNNLGDAAHKKPVVLDLPFDAAAAFHEYAIEWRKDSLRWFVDGELVYTNADTGRIPDLPLQLMMNLWMSSVVQWAGPRDDAALPAEALYDDVWIYE